MYVCVCVRVCVRACVRACVWGGGGGFFSGKEKDNCNDSLFKLLVVVFLAYGLFGGKGIDRSWL